MPVAALKRAAPQQKGAAAKRRAAEDERKVGEVTAGLVKLDGLPRDVAKMLGELLESTLPVFKDERHPFQERVVALAEEMLVAQDKHLEAKLDGTQEAITRSEQAVEPHQKQVAAAEATVAAKTGEELASKRRLAEAAQAFQDARVALAEAEASQAAFGGEIVEAAGRKASLEGIQAELVAPLSNGGLEEAARAKLVSDMVKALKAIGVEESILIALPACFGKAPEARGAFDVMVAEQLAGELSKRVAAVSAELAQAEPTKAARAAAVDAAAAQVRKTRDAQSGKAQDFWGSQIAHEAADQALAAQSQGLRELQRDEKKHRRDLKTVEAQLSSFREGALATYASLRGRERPAPEPAAPAEELAAGEGAEAASAELAAA